MNVNVWKFLFYNLNLKKNTLVIPENLLPFNKCLQKRPTATLRIPNKAKYKGWVGRRISKNPQEPWNWPTNVNDSQRSFQTFQIFVLISVQICPNPRESEIKCHKSCKRILYERLPTIKPKFVKFAARWPPAWLHKRFLLLVDLQPLLKWSIQPRGHSTTTAP